MPGTLITNGATLALTPAELEFYDVIRASATDPFAPVSLIVTAPGILDLSLELGATPAVLIAAPLGGSAIASGAGDDVLLGSAGGETLSGGVGADAIQGGAGNDRLSGGNGNDTLIDVAGDDTLLGGSGDDVIDDAGGFLSQAGWASIHGGIGDDLITLVAGSVSGGGDTDTLLVRGGDLSAVTFVEVEILATGRGTLRGTAAQLESVRAIQAAADDAASGVRLVVTTAGRLDLSEELGARDARVTLAAGATTFLAGAGDDLVVAGGADDILFLGSGNDTVAGGQGDDQAQGGDGSDVLRGGDGADRLLGEAGDDLIDGGAGNDVLDGGAGEDALRGGAGDDRYIVSETGDRVSESAAPGVDEGGLDRITASIDLVLPDFVEDLTLTGAAVRGTGNGSDNMIVGSAAGSTLAGGLGDDKLYGRGGDDWLAGGAGRDALTGGRGADSFVFLDAGATGPDRIRGFSAAEGDRLLLDGSAFAALPRGALAAAAFQAGSTVDGDDRLIYEASTGRLWYDPDGSGVAVRMQIGTLDAGATLSAASLWVI